MTIAAWLLYAPGDEPEKPLKDARFNRTRATKVLGLTRAPLDTRLKRHGIE